MVNAMDVLKMNKCRRMSSLCYTDQKHKEYIIFFVKYNRKVQKLKQNQFSEHVTDARISKGNSKSFKLVYMF